MDDLVTILPSPADVRRRVGRRATKVARYLLGVTPEPVGEFTKVPDDLPRDTLFTQPLVAKASVLGEAAMHEDGTRTVTFRVVVKDADGKRCPDLNVEARVTGPERSAVGETTTDLLGAAKFKMTSTPGEYAIEVLDVAALALEWDREASTTTANTTAG